MHGADTLSPHGPSLTELSTALTPRSACTRVPGGVLDMFHGDSLFQEDCRKDARGIQSLNQPAFLRMPVMAFILNRRT